MSGWHDAALGEVASLSLKAARGAGHDWGLAEEAADAVRVLCAAGLDGPRLLVGALDAVDTSACPICAGAALSDGARTLCAEGSEQTPMLIAGALLLPFVLRAARQQDKAFQVTSASLHCLCAPNGAIAGTVGTTLSPEVLTISRTTATAETPSVWTRARISADDWDRLHGWAARTYAPATASSRAKGAGAADDPLD